MEKSRGKTLEMKIGKTLGKQGKTLEMPYRVSPRKKGNPS